MVENRELSIIIVWPEIVQEHQFVPLMQTNFNPSPPLSSRHAKVQLSAVRVHVKPDTMMTQDERGGIDQV